MIRIQRGSEEISAFRGLGKTNPRLALAVTIMFASLAGEMCIRDRCGSTSSPC